MRKSIILFYLCAVMGCAALWTALGAISSGAQWLGTLIEVADDGSQAYFDRHPNQERERAVAQSLAQARLSLALLNEAISASYELGETIHADDKQAASDAYANLYTLLDGMGVLDARPPIGGAETDAPRPGPVHLPDPVLVDHALK